ncbi:zinc transporter ttm-1-like [Littorina saxatilis]|uniref:Zinc transporter 2 n=1 Tax=Littorina saxatilis TaxID=31220 RepID=A0AAN9ATL1_9CAEN
MEGVSGSSTNSNVNSTERRVTSQQGGRAWPHSRLDEQDDPLLDLSNEREVQQTDSRLLLDFKADDKGTLQADDRSGRLLTTVETVSSQISPRDYLTTAATINETAYGDYIDSGVESTAAAVSLSPTSVSERGGGGSDFDFFGADDPTILNTNLPFFQPRHGNMESHPDTRRTFSDTSEISASQTQTQVRPLQHQTNGMLNRYGAAVSSRGGGGGVSTVNNTAASQAGLPDVTVKQPLFLSQPHAHRSNTDRGAAAIVPTTCSSTATIVSSDTSTSHHGVVIDCTHDAVGASDRGSLTRLPRHTTTDTHAGFSQNVMLDSFPPPSHPMRGLGGLGEGEEGRGRYGLLAQDIHCHSGTSHRKMSDKLARRQLLAVLVLCVLFMIGEIIGGVLANSLALFTDVLHLASDLISYVISLLALYLSRKQATRQMTFGYHRAEVLGALFSVFIIWLVSGVLCYIAVERIIHEHYKDVKANEMLITASLGVVFNLVMGFVLHSEKCCGVAKGHAKFGHGHSHSHSHAHSHNSQYEYEPLDVASPSVGREEEEEEGGEEGVEGSPEAQGHKNINVRAAFIHVVGDIIQSLGVLVAALIIKFKQDEKYRLADPICTFVFSLLVLCTTINVLKDTLRIIMEGVPQGVDFEQLRSVLMSLDSVVSIHNLNVWALTMDRNALSVHLAVDNSINSDEVLKEATVALKRHRFYHVTIQVEKYNHDVMVNCEDCQLPVK